MADPTQPDAHERDALPPRLAAFARGLLRRVDLCAATRTAHDLADTFDPADPQWCARWSDWGAEVAADGCVLFVTAAALGAPTVGWRHERRALEHLAAAVLPSASRHRAAHLPDLAPGVRPVWWPPLALAFWIARHRTLGARDYRFERRGDGLLARCERGGDPCPEVCGETLPPSARATSRGVSTRGAAWMRLAAGTIPAADAS